MMQCDWSMGGLLEPVMQDDKILSAAGSNRIPLHSCNISGYGMTAVVARGDLSYGEAIIPWQTLF